MEELAGQASKYLDRGLNWIKANPKKSGLLGVAALGAMFLSSGDRRKRVGQAAGGALGAATVLGVVASVAPFSGKLIGKTAGWAGRRAGQIYSEAGKAWTTARAAEQGFGKAFAGSYGKSRLLMMGGGATAGFVVGTAKGDPFGGALIGAGIGLAGAAGTRGYNKYSGMGRFGKWTTRQGAVLGSTAAIFTGTRLASNHAPAEESTGDDSYQIFSGPSGVNDRMSSMNAQGDLVFGLHNRRH
jgi:hypothetical protein